MLGAAHGRPAAGAAIALALVAVHLALVTAPGPELELVLAAGALGTVLDSLQLALGTLVFPSGQLAAWLVPGWIVVMWIQFATVFHFCLAWLSRRYWLAAGLGFFGGPLSFLAGERLGAVTLTAPRGLSLAVLAAVWALALPTLTWLADRLRGREGVRYRFER